MMRDTASKRVLADLELTRGLTIQMTAIGTLGMLVGWTFFSTLYQLGTGNVVIFSLHRRRSPHSPLYICDHRPRVHTQPVHHRPSHALVVMTVVGMPLMLGLGWGWMVVPLVLNAAGAVADIWMMLMLVSYPTHARIVDHEEEVRILGRENDRPARCRSRRSSGTRSRGQQWPCSGCSFF